MINGIKRWLRPQTQADNLRTIKINLTIATVNVSLAIMCLFYVVTKRISLH